MRLCFCFRFCYDISNKDIKWRLPFDHSFGGYTKLRSHVFIKCTAHNLDMCCLCEGKPKGDYWYCRSQILCRRCYDTEWAKPDKYTRTQLAAFRVSLELLYKVMVLINVGPFKFRLNIFGFLYSFFLYVP